jgi:hypothetical protein
MKAYGGSGCIDVKFVPTFEWGIQHNNYDNTKQDKINTIVLITTRFDLPF